MALATLLANKIDSLVLDKGPGILNAAIGVLGNIPEKAEAAVTKVENVINIFDCDDVECPGAAAGMSCEEFQGSLGGEEGDEGVGLGGTTEAQRELQRIALPDEPPPFQGGQTFAQFLSGAPRPTSAQIDPDVPNVAPPKIFIPGQ